MATAADHAATYESCITAANRSCYADLPLIVPTAGCLFGHGGAVQPRKNTTGNDFQNLGALDREVNIPRCLTSQPQISSRPGARK